MNIKFEKTLQKNVCKNLIQPRRSQIYVGFQCHQKCGFCYYKNQCNTPMFNIDKIKRQIDYEYDYGIRDFEITGGEPSEYLQLRQVCQYIKEKDKTCKIAIITNGGLYLSNVWDIIDEVLVSYHLGKSDNTYNKEMFPLGCTYDKVKKTIDKARITGKLIRTNSVIGTFNINGIDSIVSDLVEFKPSIINFLPVNIFDDALSMGKYIDYNIFRQKIKRIIDYLNEKLPNTLKFIRYMPFCDMEGYEQYIVGHLQHIYDWFDWNVELSGPEVIKNAERNISLGKYGSTSVSSVLNTRQEFYKKPATCMSCKYYLICDGIEKTCDSNSVIPTHLPMIKDFMAYIKDTTYKFYKAYYGQ